MTHCPPLYAQAPLHRLQQQAPREPLPRRFQLLLLLNCGIDCLGAPQIAGCSAWARWGGGSVWRHIGWNVMQVCKCVKAFLHVAHAQLRPRHRSRGSMPSTNPQLALEPAMQLHNTCTPHLPQSISPHLSQSIPRTCHNPPRPSQHLPQSTPAHPTPVTTQPSHLPQCQVPAPAALAPPARCVSC